MKTLLRDIPAGGIMLFRYNLTGSAQEIKNLIWETSILLKEGSRVVLSFGDEGDGINRIEEIEVPPFISVDHEGGSVMRFMPGLADLPAPLSYWDIAMREGREAALSRIVSDSFQSARVISSLGVNLNFAPVVEFLTEDNAAFLRDRSYGHDVQFVTDASRAFIAGMELSGVLCVLKHFPASAGPDPHFYAASLQGDKSEMKKLALPFAALIQDNSARAVMMSHSFVPSWDENYIASLSKNIMTGWLRKELGFDGIIISDDFSMQGAVFAQDKRENILTPYEAAVKSLKQGSDMILVWPRDLRRTHNAILAALSDGSLSRQRLTNAASRIVFEKIQMGLL
jgi:beta-N-acetylhexosaminidase